MKKIVGFQNRGGMILKNTWECCDEELLELIGENGVKQMIRDLKEARSERARGFMGYPVEEVFRDMENIINETIIRQYGI